ncbi:MAG: hypothetical protein U5R31_15720 [Acidimicrobiia bacterium]|nr:hypothetical protein [Acidimicrobiia bacterium]
MDILDIIRAGVRRWTITLPVLVVAIAITAYAYAIGQSTYGACRRAALRRTQRDHRVRGHRGGSGAAEPRWSTRGSDLAAVSTAESLLDDETRRNLNREGITATYEIETSNRTPLMEITTQSTQSGSALDALGRLIDLAETSLQQRQEDIGAPEESFLSVQVLRRSATESASNASKIQNALIALALGTRRGRGDGAAADRLLSRGPGADRFGLPPPGTPPPADAPADLDDTGDQEGRGAAGDPTWDAG